MRRDPYAWCLQCPSSTISPPASKINRNCDYFQGIGDVSWPSEQSLLEDEATKAVRRMSSLLSFNNESIIFFQCPTGKRACLVGLLWLEYECVSPAYDVDNCGGCVSTGKGVSCGDYPGARGAACVQGLCDVCASTIPLFFFLRLFLMADSCHRGMFSWVGNAFGLEHA